MNYEEKYKEALEKARQEYNTTENVERKQWLEELFPELAESEDERIRKALIYGMYALKEQHKTCFASIPIDNAIAWLEKQGEFYTKRDVDNAYIEGMAFAKDELEKQGEQKGYIFKSIPRLLDMIEPSDKAKAYCQKLIDTLVKEGYNTDAKIVEEVLKGWNGKDVPMAIMDEQKPVFEMKTPEESLGIDSDTYNKIVDECIYGDDKVEPKFKVGDYIERKDGLGGHAKIIIVGVNVYGCEKLIHSEDESPFFDLMFKNQDEFQISSDFKQNSADKLEPKFHEGEWIVWKDKCYKVNYNGCGYELVDQDGLSTSLEYGTIDENAHIWDVTTDAKDGDVLISRYNKPFIYNGNWNSLNIGSYCGITTEGMFNVATEKCYWTGNVNIHPATKEQRELLFSKMKEAGYEWDAEKKELKKIEQNNEMVEALRTEYEKGRADAIAEMKPAWSEEDECYMSECIGAIATKDGWSFEEKRKTKHWLKSLKERCTWKPSDVQIKALHDLNLTGNISYAGQGQVLIELYNDLKKLAED